MRSQFLVVARTLFFCASLSFLSFNAAIQAQSPELIKIGVIGLDTSHAPAFAKLFNNADAKGEFATQQVTHAFPGGSDDIEKSYSRVPGYTEDYKKLGIEIEDSIESLVKKVDAVMVLSLDGRKHLPQVAAVFASNKPVFIDKPLAGTLAEAIAIDKLAKKHQAKWFTSSSLRYNVDTIQYRENQSKKDSVRGVIAWSPCHLEKTHPDLFWYGVHGVEPLFTAMGPGCEEVVRVSTAGTDVAIGTWKDGRVGEFRGLRDGAAPYGMMIFTKTSLEWVGKDAKYDLLAERVAQFFRGNYAGVENAESIEMFAFMEAADESKRKGGAPVKLSDVINKASLEADELLKKFAK